MLRVTRLVMLLSVCAGCAVTSKGPVLSTPSGSPEVTIVGGTVGNVWAVLSPEMDRTGYVQIRLSDYEAVFTSPGVVRGITAYLGTVVFTPRATSVGLNIKAALKLRSSFTMGQTINPPGAFPKVERELQEILERVRVALGDRAPNPR